MKTLNDRDVLLAKELYNSQCETFSYEQRKYYGNVCVRNRVNNILGEVNGKKILFAGCGDGSECDYCIRNEGDVAGIDISDRLIELARKSFPSHSDKFFVMDMEKTEFEDECFDFVVALFSLMYKENLTSVLEEFRRILKPRGSIIFSVPHPVRKMIKYNSMNYFVKGQRYEHWRGVRRFNYYRLIEDYIDSIVKSELKVVKLIEPKPPREDGYDISEFSYPHHLIFIIQKEISISDIMRGNRNIKII